MDYHDLKMFELEQAAEEHLRNALAAVDRGELAAKKEVQRWTITLENIHRVQRFRHAKLTPSVVGLGSSVQ
jgi:hypothetical protein